MAPFKSMESDIYKVNFVFFCDMLVGIKPKLCVSMLVQIVCKIFIYYVYCFRYSRMSSKSKIHMKSPKTHEDARLSCCAAC